jgi:phosphoribosylglycinamide formyltransferase-1
MLALSDAVQQGSIPNAEIALVVSDNARAQGLIIAQQRELNAVVIERRGRTREEHDSEIISALRKHETDLICLAGYMRLLSRDFVKAFNGRILNIHPSLLPSFPGLDAQRQALEHGVEWSGCTVHFVDDTLDGGPIIAQRVVRVLDDDTEESLSARILEEERKLYPEAVALIVHGEYEVIGRRVIFDLPKSD